MDVDRLNTGEKVAGVSAVLLFIFMFFDWFSAEVSGGEGLFSVSVGGSAWQAFDLIDIFLLITVIVALAVVVVRISDAVLEPPVSMNAVVAVLGGIAVLLILYRIIDPPGGGDVAGVSVDISPTVGAFLGLIAAAGITFGGYRAMQEEGTSFADVGDRLSSGGAGGPGTGGTQPPSQSPPPPPPPPPASGGPPPAQ
jgi:hypothetical protein